MTTGSAADTMPKSLGCATYEFRLPQQSCRLLCLATMELPRNIKISLIDSILSKPFPNNGVVRMGAGVELVDAKIIQFLCSSEKPWLIVERRDGDDLICSTWNGDTHTGEAPYPIDEFQDSQFRIKHYYGPSTIYYESLSDYARGYYLRVPYALIHLHRSLERAGTFLYNRRRIVLAQRLELLTFMIEQAAEGKDSFNSLDLMTDMHSIRWITHPNGESIRNRLELYLDALADTGELKKVNGDYRLTGHALRLVEERSEQERKHKQGIKIQWLIALLAFVTAVLTIVQAGLVKLNPLLDFT